MLFKYLHFFRFVSLFLKRKSYRYCENEMLVKRLTITKPILQIWRNR